MIKNKILNNVKPKKVIVAGGGIAGLTAAAYLGKNGFDVILVEKNKESGGLVNTIKVDGFKFDTGVRALLNAGIILPMLDELGINLKILPSPVSIGIEKDIINIERREDLLKYKNLLIKYYPESKKEIEKLIRIISRIMKLVDILYKVENPIFKNPLKDKNYLFTKLLPWLPQFLFAVFFINKLYIPVEKYLDKFIKNQSLNDIIYQHFFKNTSTFFALSYFSLYLNYFYPEGGTGALVDSIEKKAKEFGVRFLKQTKIEKVLVYENKVIDNNQKEYNYDYLIWAADLRYFYNIANVEKLNLKIKKNFERKKYKIFNNNGNDSVYTLFLQLDIKAEEIKNISNGHFFYTPYKNGLGSLNKKDLENIINNFDELNKEYIFNWLSDYIKYNTFEISIPCLKDKRMSPVNKTGIILSILTEYQLFKNVEKSGWLDQFVTTIENNILDILENTIYPGIKNKIISRFSFTPLSIEKRIGSFQGSIVGWAFTETIPVVNKLLKSSKSVVTPIKNVFQAGQWVYSPAGVPMSVLTGRLAADRIIKKEYLHKIIKIFCQP